MRGTKPQPAEADSGDDPAKTLVEGLRDDPRIRKALAEKIEAETQNVRELVRGNHASANIVEIEARAHERTELEVLAANKYKHVYHFMGEVGSTSASNCIEALTMWSRLDPGCDIEIVFNSPGGSVLPGLALFDYITDIRNKGHKITTVALGHAASMAGILLQAGDVRVMGRESWLLIHEISFAAIGKIGEIEDTTEWVKKIQNRVLNIFSARSKLTPKQIERRWKRKDWWISSDESLKLGLVDDLR